MRILDERKAGTFPSKVAALWISFGPYHVARIKSLAKLCDLEAIQLAGHQRLYGWPSASGSGVAVSTLSNRPWEDSSQVVLAWRVWRTLDRIQPDAVLVAGYSHLPEVTAAVWARCRGVLNVMFSESTAADYPRSPFLEACKRMVLPRLFRCAVVGGTRARNYAMDLGFREDRIVTKYDVVGNEFFENGCRELRSQSAASAFGLPSEYFLFVGRLAPEKNLAHLLRSFANYCEAGGRRELVLVGEGPLGEDLRARAGSLKCAGRIHFAGFKHEKDLLPYYAFASCFVLPSVREPWGLVVNEAAAAGLPLLVSTHCGCSDDLVESGRNGFTFCPEDETQLTAWLLSFDKKAPGELDAMGAASHAIVTQYSPDQFAANVMTILRRQSPTSENRRDQAVGAPV